MYAKLTKLAPGKAFGRPDPIERPAAPGTELFERQRVSTGQAYWALFVIVLATFMIFFDATVFGMLAERIKHDFHLTDSQLGFLAGPAGILIYIFVGIPLARLADAFPLRKLTRAFALLQFSFIGGGTAGALIGGKLVVMSAAWPVSHFGPLHMFGWQWIMV